MSTGSNNFDRSDAGGEFFRHRERSDGMRELLWGPPGVQEHGKAVLDQSGNVAFIREVDGRVIADDRL